MPKGIYKRTEKNKAWNKDTKGICKSNRTSFKKGDNKGNQNGFTKNHIPYNKGKKCPEISLRQLGKNNPAWKGGTTPERTRIWHSIEMRLWREAVFTRDNYTCQKCEQHGGTLRPHHIFNFATYLDLRFDITNGITLCDKCHQAFHKIYGNRNNTKEQLEEFIGQNC